MDRPIGSKLLELICNVTLNAKEDFCKFSNSNGLNSLIQNGLQRTLTCNEINNSQCHVISAQKLDLFAQITGSAVFMVKMKKNFKLPCPC